MSSYAKPVAFILYLILAVYALLHHEAWGDEIHSWNIAKGSASYLDVIQNSRYEGHPPTWYTIMWIVSKFTHNFSYVQLVHLVIASTTVFIILFHSPLPLLSRLLIPFGYYFAFEFSVLTRNYAIGVLLAFCICLILRKTFRYKMACYYVLLLLLSNGHLFALILAGAFHFYFLLWDYEQRKDGRGTIMHILLGLLFLLPSLYFIFPPSQGSLNLQFWMSRWDTSNFVVTAQSPIRSFIPIPAWWQAHWWNTQFLMEWQSQYRWLKYITPLLPIATIAAIFCMLKKNKKSLLLFFSNLLVTGFISIVVFPLGCARYAGLIYIGFLVAWWFYCCEKEPLRWHKWVVNILLVCQIIAAGVAIGLDSNRPFSNFSRVGALINKAPAGEKVVTDYWALNAVAAFTDKPMYCLDLKKEVSFLLWDNEIQRVLENPYRYTEGAAVLLGKGMPSFYMLSTGSLNELMKVDRMFALSYKITLEAQLEGAIEKGGNLYLYKVEP